MTTISNATVASGTGLSTAGNGGRKLVRLPNGWLVSANYKIGTGAGIKFYVSTNDGNTWSLLCTHDSTPNSGFSLAAKGTTVYYITPYGSDRVKFNRFDATTVVVGTNLDVTGILVDSSLQGMTDAAATTSLAINEAGTEIHGAWSSKITTYGSSYNIRYAKGVINGDGSVTWGAVEQVTIANNTSVNWTSPCLILKDSIPYIFVGGIDSSVNGITVLTKAFTTQDSTGGINASWGAKKVFLSTTHAQSSPSALFVHPAINGLANGRLWVAWHGKDATDSAKFNVRVSYSDDGGSTWATPVKLTSGNLYDRQNVTLAADKTGKVFALYEEHQWSPDLDIYMRTFSGGSWGAPVAVAEADPAAESNPSALVDYTLQMTTPPFVFMSGTDGIKFSGNFNVGASVSPASGALGNKETATLTAYTVTPEAGSTVTSVVEKVNGVTVNTFNNPASLSRTLTVPTATWDTLAYFATHTASIAVTDSNGATTVTTYSFDKRLATGASLLEATKANTDAKNRISTKRDVLASQVGLSAGSTFDAISAQLASGNAFKKFATGTVTSGGSQLPFVYQTGSTLNNYFVTVSGLNFLPKTIIIFATSNQPQTFYVDGLRWNGVVGQDTLMSQTLNYFRTTGNLYVTDSGFRLPVSNTAITYSWIAYE